MLFENSTILPAAHIIAFIFGLFVFFIYHHKIRIDKITIITGIFALVSFLYKDFSVGLWSSIGLPQMPTSLFICWLVFIIIYNQDDFRFTAKCIVYSAVCLTILMVIIVQTDLLHGLHSSAANARLVRYGFNSNTVGVYTCFGAIFALLLEKKKWYNNFAFMYLAFFSIISGSRTILLVYAVALFVYLLSQKNKTGYILIGVLAVGIGIYLIYSVPTLYIAIGVRFDSLVSSILGYVRTKSFDNITETRFRMIIIGWNYFLESPVFGNGLASFAVRYSIINQQAAVYSHCNFIELLSGMGLVGFTIYYYRFFVQIKMLIANKSVKQVPLILGVFCALLFMDISVISYYYKMYYIFFACLSLYAKNIVEMDIEEENG